MKYYGTNKLVPEYNGILLEFSSIVISTLDWHVYVFIRLMRYLLIFYHSFELGLEITFVQWAPGICGDGDASLSISRISSVGFIILNPGIPLDSRVKPPWLLRFPFWIPFHKVYVNGYTDCPWMFKSINAVPVFWGSPVHCSQLLVEWVVRLDRLVLEVPHVLSLWFDESESDR